MAKNKCHYPVIRDKHRQQWKQHKEEIFYTTCPDDNSDSSDNRFNQIPDAPSSSEDEFYDEAEADEETKRQLILILVVL